jgi:hypothetical protein
VQEHDKRAAAGYSQVHADPVRLNCSMLDALRCGLHGGPV